MDGAGNRLAQDVQAALEKLLVGDAGAATDEHLAGDRLARNDTLAENGRIDRHVAPAQKHLALGYRRLLDDLLDDMAGFGVARHEQDADRVVARAGQLEPALLRPGDEEIVRDLDEHAAAIARLGVGAGRAAMVEVEEDLQAHRDEIVRLAIMHVRHETHAAGIMLLGRIVETLSRRKRGIAHDDIAANGWIVRPASNRRRRDVATLVLRGQAIHVVPVSHYRSSHGRPASQIRQPQVSLLQG